MVWAECAACGLKHSVRVDGVCPRCRAEAGSTVQVLELPLRPRPRSDLQAARRLAAIAFFAHAAFALAAILVERSTSLNAAAAALGVAIDLALGVALLGDGDWAPMAALVRSCVGIGAVAVTIFAPVIGLGSVGEMGELRGVMRFFFFSGMIIMLAGTATRARRWTGALLAFVPYVVLKLVGAFEPAIVTGDFSAPFLEFVRAFLRAG